MIDPKSGVTRCDIRVRRSRRKVPVRAHSRGLPPTLPHLLHMSSTKMEPAKPPALQPAPAGGGAAAPEAPPAEEEAEQLDAAALAEHAMVFEFHAAQAERTLAQYQALAAQLEPAQRDEHLSRLRALQLQQHGAEAAPPAPFDPSQHTGFSAAAIKPEPQANVDNAWS